MCWHVAVNVCINYSFVRLYLLFYYSLHNFILVHTILAVPKLFY